MSAPRPPVGAPHTAAPVDPGWGPTVRERGRRRRPWRLLRWLLLLAALTVVVVVGVAWWQLTRVPVEGLAAGGRPLNILVVGSDSREGLTPEQRRELTTGDAEGVRADTIMVLTVRGTDAALLSFPRDLWVQRCDGSAGRINAALPLGGPGCLVRTVRDVSGIDIHHYAEVEFGGFVGLVDAVGGVELCLEAPIADRSAGIDLSAGCQRLDGPDALGYVRVRKIDDDFGRMERQQAFVRALAAEVLSPRVLLNPVRTVRLASAGGDALVVDDQLGPLRLARLALGGTALARGTAAAHTVPGDPDITAGGAWVLRQRTGEAEALYASFRTGAVLDERPPGSADAGDAPRPQDIEVTVLNGAGIGGIAGRVADELTGAGFEVVGVGNHERVTATVVRHPPDQAAAAALVAARLRGTPTLQPTTSVSTITVVLGPDAGA